MKYLILVVSVLGVASAGEPENREKRGLVSSLGYGIGSSLAFSSPPVQSLSLPLSASVLSEPVVHHSASSLSLPLSASVVSEPVVHHSVPVIHSIVEPQHHIIDTVVAHPQIVKVVSQPQFISYDSALSSSLGSYGYSSIPSIGSGGLLKSYKLGGIPVTDYKSHNAW